MAQERPGSSSLGRIVHTTKAPTHLGATHPPALLAGNNAGGGLEMVSNTLGPSPDLEICPRIRPVSGWQLATADSQCEPLTAQRRSVCGRSPVPTTPVLVVLPFAALSWPVSCLVPVLTRPRPDLLLAPEACGGDPISPRHGNRWPTAYRPRLASTWPLTDGLDFS